MRTIWLRLPFQQIRRKRWTALICAVLISIGLFKYYSTTDIFEPDDWRARWRHSGGYDSDIPWKHTAAIPPPLRVYIVEEHHEVIPFWVDTVNAHGGTKANLIHIDAHSDLDYPELVPNFPIGRRPENDVELSTLMQANDQFIQSAVVSQLINTTYVIYPSWASNESLVFEARLGLTVVDDKQQLCMCFFDEGPECLTRDLEHPLDNMKIKYDQCKVKWMYNYLELQSQHAAGILKSSKRWSINKTHGPLILDIDEDYFGVHLATRNLTAVSFSISRVEQIDECIQNTFCPKSPELEPVIDRWFTRVVQYIKTNCFQLSTNVARADVSRPCTDNLYHFIHQSLEEHRDDWLCDVNVEDSSLKLTDLLLNPSTTKRQLTVLEKVGLCLTMSWSTHFYEPHMRLCVGHNSPEHSLVEEYVPNSTELYRMASNVTEILLALPKAPSVVTICRSSRDGYTPRWLQSHIETILLGLLTRVFNISQESIYYSPHLAGGRLGWNNRQNQIPSIPH